MTQTNQMITVAVETGSKFPPAFQGDALTYAFALASMSALSFISFAILVGYVLEARLNSKISTRLCNWVRDPDRSTRTIGFYDRLVTSGFLISILMGTFPDVMVMVTWREVSSRTMLELYHIDRFFDSLVVIPYLFSVFLGLGIRQAKRHKLNYEADYHVKPSRIIHWSDALEKAKIIFLALVLAAGIAFYKSLG